jgi:hypothetical protein
MCPSSSNSLSNRVLSWLLPAWCLCFALLLGLPGAAYVPDAGQYRLLALGQHGAVPAPFSARILGPAMAGWLGRATGRGVDTGFLVLGIVCLIALLGLMAGLLWSWRAPLVLSVAIFLMPFWVDIFHDYYLPDLLHAALLAALLLFLLSGYTSLAFLLLFPAYLARESTLLVAGCLVFACWRRIRLRPALAGALAILSAGLISRHYNQEAAVSVHGIGGGTYILGKFIWSFFKNVLGMPLWSNTLPECSPIWVKAIPPGAHFGAIRSIGLCQPSLWGPTRLLLAWFGIFGIGPALALALWHKLIAPARELTPGRGMVLRFCLVYGVISILMAPLLGASADRLVEYGWPFYLVFLPWFLSTSYDLRGLRPWGLMLLHLLTCWLAWFAFRLQPRSYLPAVMAVLFLNALAYVLLRRSLPAATGYSPQVT